MSDRQAIKVLEELCTLTQVPLPPGGIQGGLQVLLGGQHLVRLQWKEPRFLILGEVMDWGDPSSEEEVWEALAVEALHANLLLGQRPLSGYLVYEEGTKKLHLVDSLELIEATPKVMKERVERLVGQQAQAKLRLSKQKNEAKPSQAPTRPTPDSGQRFVMPC